MPPCVQYDDLWPGGPRFARSGAGFALGTDSVLLADFAADRRVRRFADLGCGAGVLTVLLLVLVFLLPYAALIPMPTIAASLLQVAYNMSGWRIFAHLCATASRGAVASLLLTFTLTIVRVSAAQISASLAMAVSPQ